MAIQKVQQAQQFSDPLLRLNDIQGDVLIGLQKDAECFLFFAIDDVPAFKKVMREDMSARITSTSDVMAREALIAAAKASGSGQRLRLIGVNVSFTFAGLKRLTDVSAIEPQLDASYTAGAAARTGALADDPAIWLAPFKTDAVHGLFIVTAQTHADADSEASDILALFGGAISEVYRDMGETRPQRGHEHFGFLDGVSQPGIRGLTARENPLDSDQGLPGQDLLWPGEFVFGYPGQSQPGIVPTQVATEGPVKTPPADWMLDGSFMVWRRLEQKVLSFRETVKAKALELGMDSELLAARMVGRWPSGAPLIAAPLQDDPTLGGDKAKNNDFEFGNDPEQRRCPYAAHIRKTYPRDDLGDAGEVSVQLRRLRRAGIPFGPEVDDAKESLGNEASRGLMFVCYQTSIVGQFEFVQKSWANNTEFVFGKQRPGGGAAVIPGHDPIIGQAVGARVMDEPVANYPMGDVRQTLPLPEQFVRSTGAAYFFVPSLLALRTGPLVSA